MRDPVMASPDIIVAAQDLAKRDRAITKREKLVVRIFIRDS